jgi:hypothetical protein
VKLKLVIFVATLLFQFHNINAQSDPPKSLPHIKSGWTFNLLIGINDTTVKYYGGYDAAKNLILAQIDRVNNKFNFGSPFINNISFVVDSCYEFTGSVYDQIFLPHPNQNYRVIYDGFPTQGGGNYGTQYSAIYHSWNVNYFGGTFGDYATDGLTHEFGHSRGAIDLYATSVSSTNNIINGASYIPPVSIMNYPYGTQIWDTHSINIINRNSNIILANENYINQAFPPQIIIKTIDENGTFIQGVELKVYPVLWYKDSISSIPLYTDTTNTQGEYFFNSNPFEPNTVGSPWSIKYPNFLITAKYAQYSGFKWLPLIDVQNSFFENATRDYTLEIKLDKPNLISDQKVNHYFSLDQNYPNPFNHNTVISYSLPAASNMKLIVYNTLGQTITTLESGFKPAGNYTINFNASNLSSGIYFYKLEAGQFNQIKKMMLIK